MNPIQSRNVFPDREVSYNLRIMNPIQSRNVFPDREVSYNLRIMNPIQSRNVFPDREVSYNLRIMNPIQSRNVSTVYNGTETIYFRGPKTWALLPGESETLIEFKTRIKQWEPKGCTCRICKTFIKNLGFI